MKLTLSVRSFQVPATPGTCAWPPSLPSVPTSRATRVTSDANALSWSTIVLMVFFSSRISPRTSTVILRERSPRATAVVTSAMLRTWSVRLRAIALTESVRSFQVPATPGTTACPPSRPSVPTSCATRVTSDAKERSWSTIVLMASLSCRISPRTSTVILRDRSPLATAMVTSEMLRTCAGQVARHRVDAVGQVLPDAADVADLRLAAELAVGADLARDARDFRREHAQLLDHRVDDRGRAQELTFERAALDVEPHRLQQVALGDGRQRAGHFGRRPQQVVDQRVDRRLHLAPGATRPAELDALPRLALLADDGADPFQLVAILAFEATIPLNVSAIFPSIPVQSPGSRTEKSPSCTACKARSNSESWEGGRVATASGGSWGTVLSVRGMVISERLTIHGERSRFVLQQGFCPNSIQMSRIPRQRER